jgi:hypothetical protein
MVPTFGKVMILIVLWDGFRNFLNGVEHEYDF